MYVILWKNMTVRDESSLENENSCILAQVLLV